MRENPYHSTPRRQRHRNCFLCELMMYVGYVSLGLGNRAASVGVVSQNHSKWIFSAATRHRTLMPDTSPAIRIGGLL